jgi:hypothetical protein
MIIVIEGPDGAGKTTLAKQLARDFDLEYHHEGPPPPNRSALDHYGKLLEDARGKRVVFDRLALGERVYGPILRGKDGLGDLGWRLITRLMRSLNAVHIACLPDLEVCHKSWASGRAELFKDEGKFFSTYSAYWDLLRSDLGYGHYIYDWTYKISHCDSRGDDAYPALRKYLRTFSGLAVGPPGHVGAPNAKYLFVGDIGSNPDAVVDLPFWYTGNSSQYLHDAIALAGFREDEIGLVNSKRHDGRPQAFTRSDVVIALGDSAFRSCRLRGVDMIAALRQVPHPQYWKRFHNSDIEGYAAKLKQAAGR